MRWGENDPWRAEARVASLVKVVSFKETVFKFHSPQTVTSTCEERWLCLHMHGVPVGEGLTSSLAAGGPSGLPWWSGHCSPMPLREGFTPQLAAGEDWRSRGLHRRVSVFPLLLRLNTERKTQTEKLLESFSKLKNWALSDQQTTVFTFLSVSLLKTSKHERLYRCFRSSSQCRGLSLLRDSQ